MKDTIYLYADRDGVNRMRKTLGEYKRGEIPIKLTIEVADKAFQPPVVEQYVSIDDWRDDFMVEDIQMDEHTITAGEARLIVEARVERAREMLEERGYQVVEPLGPDEEQE